MAWNITFAPDDGDGVSLIINGELWCRHVAGDQTGLTWKKAEGKVAHLALPGKWAGSPEIIIVGVAYPWGKQVQFAIFWDNQFKHLMRFSKEEQAEVSHRRQSLEEAIRAFT